MVLANCVNMGLRILFNLGFVRGWFGQRGTVGADFASLFLGERLTCGLQAFNMGDILPSMYATAATAVVPSVLSQTRGLAMLLSYGVVGELVRIGVIGAEFAAVM